MRSREIWLGLILVLGLAACNANEPGQEADQAPSPAPAADADTTRTLDLSNSADAMQAFIKMRCSLDPDEDVVAWWYGTMLANVPGAAPRPILGFEGFNICRMLPTDDGGYQFVSREVTYYSDLVTGEILESWDNPYTGETVTVLQVANDPVSHIYPPAAQRDYGQWPWREIEGSINITLNIPLDYANALQPDEYPAESSGERYLASEHFMFFVERADIDNPALSSAPSSYGWARTGPWLPWMRMGQRPGGLIYAGQGKKLSGFDALPDTIREYTLKHFPEYRTAPDSYYQPNETSWTYYRKLQEAARDSENASESDSD